MYGVVKWHYLLLECPKQMFYKHFQLCVLVERMHMIGNGFIKPLFKTKCACIYKHGYEYSIYTASGELHQFDDILFRSDPEG